MSKTWRPPPVSRKLAWITRWCAAQNNTNIKTIIERSLLSFLQSEIDEIMDNNIDSTIEKAGREHLKWLRTRESQLYGAP